MTELARLGAFWDGPVPYDEAPRWALNHSLDLVVQTLEMVTDIDGVVTGWDIAEKASALTPGPEAAEMTRVWAAMTMVARSIALIRTEADQNRDPS